MNVMSKTITRTSTAADGGIPPAAHSAMEKSSQSSRHTPSLTAATLNTTVASAMTIASEATLKTKALQVLVAVLTSLVDWANKGFEIDEAQSSDLIADDMRNPSMEIERPSSRNSTQVPSTPPSEYSSATATDDPEQFHSLKHKKQRLQEGIRMFAWKPKRVIFFAFY